MYRSDYAFATGGGGSYSRSSCLNKELYHWTDNYQTYCANNSWLLYYNTTSSSAGTKSPSQKAIASTYTSSSAHVFGMSYEGINYVDCTRSEGPVRPVLFLKTNVGIISGNGAYASPYVLQLN